MFQQLSAFFAYCTVSHQITHSHIVFGKLSYCKYGPIQCNILVYAVYSRAVRKSGIDNRTSLIYFPMNLSGYVSHNLFQFFNRVKSVFILFDLAVSLHEDVRRSVYHNLADICIIKKWLQDSEFAPCLVKNSSDYRFDVIIRIKIAFLVIEYGLDDHPHCSEIVNFLFASEPFPDSFHLLVGKSPCSHAHIHSSQTFLMFLA